MSRVTDLTGRIFTRWTVIERAPTRKNLTRWWCRCECGAVVSVMGSMLTAGNTKSCGCLRPDVTRKRATTHGMARPNQRAPEYGVWSRMLRRVRNPADAGYKNYGGRGITVCDSWRDFPQFYADMGPRPSPKHSLDRIDNNAHYSCGHCVECLTHAWQANCRWATRDEQANNKRNNVNIEYQGQVKNITQWANVLNIPRHALVNRIRHYGWTVERALTTSVQPHRPYSNSKRP